MKPKVVLHKKTAQYFLVEKFEKGIASLRLLTKSGMFTLQTKKTELKRSEYVEIKNCSLYQRIKFNKVEVDKIAFEDFIDHLNKELYTNLVYAIQNKTSDELLRKVSRVVFSVFHLSKKEHMSFDLDDVLERMDKKLMATAVKKSMVQYLQERVGYFGDNPDLEPKYMQMEMELAKTIFTFSSAHPPIRKAAEKYLKVVISGMRDRGIYEE